MDPTSATPSSPSTPPAPSPPPTGAPAPSGPAGGWSRRGGVLAVGTVALVAFVAATVAAGIGDPAPWELRSFEAVNGLPDWLHPVIWPFMQYGVFVTIPIATVVALVLRRHRLATLLISSGVAIYLGAKVVKRIADRGRPNAFLVDVVEREHFAATSLGYTSGHTAVAATIATLSWFHLPRWLRRTSAALVAIVSFGRMYVGAHLPLDLVGGVAMGVAAGCFVTVAFGRLPAGPGEDGGREEP